MEIILEPKKIEEKSFQIISQTIGERKINEEQASIIKRVIHTSADFDYLDNLVFSNNAVQLALDLFKNGANIITDTNMAMAGINKKALEELGCKVNCFIGSTEVANLAKEKGVTRSSMAVEHAFKTLGGPRIFVVGNAPTALLKLHELITSGVYVPDFIVGVPVGFVNVVESKELIMNLDIPFIVAKGRKGGSNVAAAIINALMYKVVKR